MPSLSKDRPRTVAADYTGRGLANLGSGVCRALGGASDGLAAPLTADVMPPRLLDGVQTVVLVVIDGLGYTQLEAGLEAGDAPTLSGLVKSARDGDGSLSAITSVFPSATMAALTSINTGVAPAQHGIMGWTVYLEEFGQPTEMARWGPIGRANASYQDAKLGGHDPVAFLGVPTIYRRLAQAGVQSFIVNPADYRGSALSRMLFDGAEEVGYRPVSGFAVNLERVLAARDVGRRYLVYAYLPGLDSVAHPHGPGSPNHAAELATIDFLLGRWLTRAERDGRTLVVLTADHGHVCTPKERTMFVDRPADVMRLLICPPTGERRVLYLHVREGRLAEARSKIEAAWGSAGTVHESAKLLAEGWFGPQPISAAARRRAGDLVLLPRDDWQFTYGPRPNRPARLFAGNHGALDRDEMLVPLLAWRI